MINSREKGKRFERKLAALFREYGYDAHRTAQYCGNTGDAADVVGLPGIHVEAKSQERIQIYDWMAQAVNDSRSTGNLPAVFFKKNNCEILVAMRMSDWFELFREWDAGNLPFTEGDDDNTTEG